VDSKKPFIKGWERLGFSTVEDYFESEIWKVIEGEVLLRDDWTCEFCGEPATKVDTQSYKPGRLLGREPTYFFSVCNQCYDEIHQGRSLQEAATYAFKKFFCYDEFKTKGFRGRSNPQLAKDLRARHNKNVQVAETIYDRLKEEVFTEA
jgi:hypothetical protein